MSDGRGKMEWAQTSSIMAIIANIMRDPKKGKGAKPGDFNPYMAKKEKAIKAPLTVLRDVFCKTQKD